MFFGRIPKEFGRLCLWLIWWSFRKMWWLCGLRKVRVFSFILKWKEWPCRPQSSSIASSPSSFSSPSSSPRNNMPFYSYPHAHHHYHLLFLSYALPSSCIPSLSRKLLYFPAFISNHDSLPPILVCTCVRPTLSIYLHFQVWKPFGWSAH